jgi:hypothetical protein
MRICVFLVLTTSAMFACVAQAPPPAYYPAGPGAQQPAYGQAAPGAQVSGTATAGMQLPPAPPRQITINGAPASAQDLATLDMLEQQWGGRLPSGDYWYDNTSGAAGRWGGPIVDIMPAGLQLGGPLPANASGGGNGMLTGVFINGRELHPYDVQQLQALVGEVPQGRWWVDGNGNFGMEGGPLMGNLHSIAQQNGGGGSSTFSSSSNGSVFAKGGCVSVTSSDGGAGMSIGC